MSNGSRSIDDGSDMVEWTAGFARPLIDTAGTIPAGFHLGKHERSPSAARRPLALARRIIDALRLHGSIAPATRSAAGFHVSFIEDFFGREKAVQGGRETGIHGHLNHDFYDFLRTAPDIQGTMDMHLQLGRGRPDGG